MTLTNLTKRRFAHSATKNVTRLTLDVTETVSCYSQSARTINLAICCAMIRRAGADSDYTKAMATISFKTTDYIPLGQRLSRDVASA